MEIVLLILISSVLIAIATFLIAITMGGLFGMQAPSWGGLVWRCGVMGLVISIGSLIPIPFIAWVAGGGVLVGLFDLSFPDDWWKILLFMIALIIATFIVSIVVVALLSAMGYAIGA